MGFFSAHYTRPGPGIPKNLPKKKGFARYFDIFTRNISDLFLVNLYVTLTFIPASFFLAIFLLSNPKPLLFLILTWLLLIPVGPAIVSLNYITIKMIRDIPNDIWYDFKKNYKSNFKQACVATAFIALFFLGVIFIFTFILITDIKMNFFVMFCLFFSILLFTSMSNLIYSQIATVALPLKAIIKNSLLLTFAFVKRTIPAFFLEIVILVAFALFLPISSFVAFLGLLSIVNLTVNFINLPALKFVCKDLEGEIEASSDASISKETSNEVSLDSSNGNNEVEPSSDASISKET